MSEAPNPYSPPLQDSDAADATAPTVQVAYFRIAEHDFSCTALSRAELVEACREELIEFCQDMGFRAVPGEADYQITGAYASGRL